MQEVKIQEVSEDNVRFPITNGGSPINVKIVESLIQDSIKTLPVKLMSVTANGLETVALVQLRTIPRKDESVLFQSVGSDENKIFRVMEVVHTEEGLMLYGTVSLFAIASVRNS